MNAGHRLELDELERSLSHVVRLLADRSLNTDIARRAGHDLPPASWALMEHLEDGGSMRVSDIAACHGVDVSSITPRIKALEAAEMITRNRLPDDARVSMISISTTGRRALHQIHSARRELLAAAAVDINGVDLATASRVLAQIIDALSAVGTQRLNARQL
jgi:DNA-binding MarR family transcriptional regulator